MKVKDRNRISVIMKPERDESVITDIYKTDEFVWDEDKKESVRRSEKLIDYTFYFLADLRKILNNNLTSVRFSARVGQRRSHYSFFSDLDSQDPRSIVAALYAKSEDIKSEMFESDANGLIYRKNIDLFKQFDAFKLRNFKKFSDRELFGTIEKSVIVNVSKGKKLGRDQQVAQKSLTNIDKNLLNSMSFIRNYEKSLSLGIDPGSMLFPTDDETPADPRKSGTFSKQSLHTGNYTKDSCFFSLRNHMIGFLNSTDESTDKKSTNQFSDGSSVAIIEKQINRIRLIPVKVTFKKSDLIGVNRFSIIVDAINDKGIIFQTLSMNINHTRNIDDYYAPISGIEAKLAVPFDSHRRSARLSLRKSDPAIAGCDIYIRRISEAHSFSQSPFLKVKRVMFRDRGKTYDDSFHYPVHEMFTIPYVESKLSIMRVVPVSKSGKVFGNFTSSVKKNGPFIPFRAAISTSCTSDGIVLHLGSISANIAGACFERRNVTRKEKNFKKVIGAQILDKNDNSFKFPSLGAGSLSSKGILGEMFRVIDTNCEEDHLYEYRARLYLKEGVTKTSEVSRFQKYIRPMGVISTIVSDPVVTPPNTKPLKTEIDAGNSPVVISFNIGFQILPTSSDKILQALTAVGLQGLYSSDVESIRSQLQNLIFFNIERFNLATGETAYLGVFPQGVRIVDDGIVTEARGPIMGQNYRYKVTPCLASPQIAVQSAKSSGTARVNPRQIVSNSSYLRNPSTYIQLQQAYGQNPQPSESSLLVSYGKIKSIKNFSKPSLVHGMIPTSNRMFSLASFSTGDSVEVSCSTGYPSVLIKNVNMSLGVRAGPIIRWRSAGGRSARKLVDFFVVLVKKQDEKYIAGVCHRLESDNFSFVDFSNKDYVGSAEYSVKPVFLDGKIGKEVLIGTLLMPDRSVIFKRGN